MTAFRYDMQIRMNVFAHRVPSKDGAALPDIAVKQGISHAAYNPDTGTKRPDLIKASLFPSARGSTHQGGNGGFQHDNHQSRRRDTRRFGRGNGPDQWGNFNYGFQNQGYDGSNYGYNHQYNNQQPSYNHQNRQQFNGNFGHSAASGSGQGGGDSRKRFRPSQGQGENDFNTGSKKSSDALTKQ
ncbi:hypothetical protein PGT21_018904 [Puccinia graminis f. sp. tritici]|uniref:Uncharacterized protein n=1 Tax=Puccinia graminis f. sp. tritici TaxID=56615 RepID=A0A5B0PKD6_PUCGR|nr:hypothetical protein PGT21_018904 [Puccinia graminis f. sp. tritici]